MSIRKAKRAVSGCSRYQAYSHPDRVIVQSNLGMRWATSLVCQIPGIMTGLYDG